MKYGVWQAVFSLAMIAVFPAITFAAEVNIQANVIERKSSDTINDFNLSLTPQPAGGRVLGATAERSPAAVSINTSDFQKIVTEVIISQTLIWQWPVLFIFI